MHTSGFEMLPNDGPGPPSFGGSLIDDDEGPGLGRHKAMVNRQLQMVNWPMLVEG
jgi:hypothetical protein